MKLKKFAAVALSVALAAASMPISGLAAEDPYKGLLTLEVSPAEAEVLLGGTTELKATVATDANALESDSNAAYASASNAKINWSSDSQNITVNDKGVVTAVKYEMGGNNTAKISASLSESVSDEAVVTIAAPVLTVGSDLEVSPEKGATITPELTKVAESVKADYSYVSDNKSVAVSTSGEVTAKDAKNGDKAVVTVTAKYNNAAIAEAKVNVTVKDTTPVANTLEWAETAVIPVRLVVNGEANEAVQALPFESSYNDGFEVTIDNGNVADVEIIAEKEAETGYRYVNVTAKAVGKATVTLSHKDNLITPITADVFVTDAGDPITVNADQAPFVDKVVPEEDAALLTASLIEKNPELAPYKEEIEKQLTEQLHGINNNEAMNSELAIPVWPENIDSIVKDIFDLKPGETLELSLYQGISAYSYGASVSGNEVETYFNGLEFEVTPVIAVTNNGEVVIPATPLALLGEEYEKLFDLGDSTMSFILPVPDSSHNRFSFAKVSHNHGGVADADRWPEIEGSEGGRYVSVSTKNFSTFELAFTNDKDSNSSSNTGSGWVKPAGSGAGSSSGSNTNSNMNAKGGKSGQWQQNEKGWWFRYTDGTYPSNEWVELEWQNVKNWYFFDAEGYLVTGWKQDGATWYYLHPIADGTQGHMYTGWNQIDGKWYYFSTVAGGPLGAMLSNTTTPDGYQVGADGAWIQ